MLSFFPRDVLDKRDLIEPVSGGFPTFSSSFFYSKFHDKYIYIHI